MKELRSTFKVKLALSRGQKPSLGYGLLKVTSPSSSSPEAFKVWTLHPVRAVLWETAKTPVAVLR